MKKLSELLKEQAALEEQSAGTALTDKDTTLSTQALVLFDNVLDGEKLLQSPEIEVLVNHFFGRIALTIADVKNADHLHDWARDEQYKADTQEHAMIYYVKAKFEDLRLDTCSNQFSGPLYVQVFHPDGFIYDVLTVTCYWNDGLFRNDYYVVGVIADKGDLERIIKGVIK